MTRLVVVSVFALALTAVIWLAPRPTPQPPGTTAMAFSPDGRLLITAINREQISVLDWSSRQEIARFPAAGGAINTISVSPDSRLAAIAGRSLELRRTDNWMVTGQPGPSGAVYGTARFSPDGTRIATINAAEQVELRDAATGALQRTLCCVALYGDLAFSPDGARIATTGHWPRIWDTATGSELLRLVGTREPTFAPVAFSPDGRFFATGSQDGRARLWDANTAAELRRSRPRNAYIESLAFHPDGERIAYGTRDGSIWLWNLTTGNEDHVGSSATANPVFSPDGRWLAIAHATQGLVTIPMTARAN